MIGKFINWAAGRFGGSKTRELEAAFNEWALAPARDARQEAIDKERSFQKWGAEGLASMGELSALFITLLMVFKGQYAELTRDHGDSLQTGTMALAISLGLTITIFCGFVIAMKLTPLMSRASTYFAGWVCVACLVLFAVGTSSFYAFMAIAGNPAVNMHLIDEAARLDRAVLVVTDQIRKARGMPSAMEAKAAGFATQSASEVAGGGGTGARGAGPLSQSLAGAADVLRTGAAGIRTAVEKADIAAAEMRETVRSVTVAVGDRDVSSAKREDALLKGAASVQAQVSAMTSAGLIEIVKSTLAAVRSAVSSLPTEKSKIGERQQAAMESIRADMEQIATDLEAVVSELQVAKDETGSLVQMASLSDVVWKYKLHFKPALLLAVGIDCFAIWALIMLGLHGIEKREPKKRKPVKLDELVGGEILSRDVLRQLQLPGGRSESAAATSAEPREGGDKSEKKKGRRA